MAKKLYLVFKLDETAGQNKFLTVILANPKDDLTAATVKAAMDLCIDKHFFKSGGRESGFDVVEAWDAYVRDDNYIIDNGQSIGA